MQLKEPASSRNKARKRSISSQDSVLIPVAANGVAFSIHAGLLTASTLLQVTIYDRGTQKVLKNMHGNHLNCLGCSLSLSDHCLAKGFMALACFSLQSKLHIEYSS